MLQVYLPTSAVSISRECWVVNRFFGKILQRVKWRFVLGLKIWYTIFILFERGREVAEDLQSKRIAKMHTSVILSLCFLVPALVMLLAMAAFGMAPFGDRSTLIMDMSGQYVEFFCGLKQVLRDGNLTSLFFSWSKSMGGNGVGVFAYYVSSPLSWLTLFVPNNAMPIGLLFLSILKIGLCGLTMGIFLHRMGFKNNLAAVLFATAYGLM